MPLDLHQPIKTADLNSLSWVDALVITAPNDSLDHLQSKHFDKSIVFTSTTSQ